MFSVTPCIYQYMFAKLKAAEKIWDALKKKMKKKRLGNGKATYHHHRSLSTQTAPSPRSSCVFWQMSCLQCWFWQMYIPKQSQDFCLVTGSVEGYLGFVLKKKGGGGEEVKKKGFCQSEGRWTKQDTHKMYVYTACFWEDFQETQRKNHQSNSQTAKHCLDQPLQGL